MKKIYDCSGCVGESWDLPEGRTHQMGTNQHPELEKGTFIGEPEATASEAVHIPVPMCPHGMIQGKEDCPAGCFIRKPILGKSIVISAESELGKEIAKQFEDSPSQPPKKVREGKKCLKHGVVHKNGGYDSCYYPNPAPQETKQGWEEEFDKNYMFHEGNGEGIMKDSPLMTNIKSFIRNLLSEKDKQIELEAKNCDKHCKEAYDRGYDERGVRAGETMTTLREMYGEKLDKARMGGYKVGLEEATLSAYKVVESWAEKQKQNPGWSESDEEAGFKTGINQMIDSLQSFLKDKGQK